MTENTRGSVAPTLHSTLPEYLQAFPDSTVTFNMLSQFFAMRRVFKGVELNSKTNNTEHHTVIISSKQLMVRRGQPFTVTLKLTEALDPALNPLTVVAVTGQNPSEDGGTKSCFGIPDNVKRSPSAKAIWKVELHKNSSPSTGDLALTITPPACAPIGQYTLTAQYKNEETSLATLVMLFNPWCPDDLVFLPDEAERQEYVMNEHGVIYRGSQSYITQTNWDFGQFEDNMVDICLKILDKNNKHLKNLADDESARCDPIYVGRVVSAMINSQDDSGVVVGNWDSSFEGGVSPSHWNGSYAILKQWFNTLCTPVKYGQCWVYAGVMCSVMRLLGIPCRVVTNFSSAHDCNGNLIIDVYHADSGVLEKESDDSVWNFHVWVEGWMKRPDLAQDGKYDGWQVLDPTPQETSDGVYCCGPASVKAILSGETTLNYDVPFIFAEVNADCIDWLIKANGSKVKIFSDTKRVGSNISTKSVGSNKRMDITHTYKYPEGSKEERDVFNYASSRSQVPPVSIRFEEVSKPVNGQDVNLKLVLRSDSTAARPLSINISVQAMKYNNFPAVNIKSEVKQETLQPGKDLSIPILVPFSTYRKPMVQCDSMKISVIVTDKQSSENKYLAVNDVVLTNPPLSLTVSGEVKVNCEARGEVIFMNPINETLTNCTLTLSGSGLMEEEKHTLVDLHPNNRVRVTFTFLPYKDGQKTIIANFNCSAFRGIKKTCPVSVKP